MIPSFSSKKKYYSTNVPLRIVHPTGTIADKVPRKAAAKRIAKSNKEMLVWKEKKCRIDSNKHYIPSPAATPCPRGPCYAWSLLRFQHKINIRMVEKWNCTAKQGRDKTAFHLPRFHQVSRKHHFCGGESMRERLRVRGCEVRGHGGVRGEEN